MNSSLTLPEGLQERIRMHTETAPYHIQQAANNEAEYRTLETWDNIRHQFPILRDEDLQAIDANSLTPQHFTTDELITSRSSGTTGPPKEIHWHVDDVADNVDYVADTIRGTTEPAPHASNWVGTTTPNPVLKRKLSDLAERFDSRIDLIDVDPTIVKRALQSGQEATINDTLAPLANRIRHEFETDPVEVYEDIAPLMKFVGTRLPTHLRQSVELLLIGGVGTDEATVEYLTEEVFPSATLTGWYGDYLNGSSMMCAPSTLTYRPLTPEVRLEVRQHEDLRSLVDPGERGVVVSTAIRRGFFVPNRIVGDTGRRVIRDGTDCITDLARLETIPQPAET